MTRPISSPARDYDPATGQFLTVDPLVGTTHQPYAYVGNDPLTGTDPLGLCFAICLSSFGHAFSSGLSKLNDATFNFLTHGFGAHMVSFIEGFGNAVSFGLTTKFDNWVSPGSSCTYAHDGWYTAGDVTGQVVLAVVTDGGSTEEEAALDAARGAESLATHEAEATAEREAENAAERAGAKAADRGPTCGGESFTAATAVVMADGTVKALDRIKVGDKVRAVDPKTGKATVRTVSRVWVNHDTDLMDVTVRSAGRDSVIDATQHHLFWDASRSAWVEAQSLRAGERLTDDDGRIVTVVRALVVPGAMDMWDLTVDQDHDFFVVTETTTVLVHNIDETCDLSSRAARRQAMRDAGIPTSQTPESQFGTEAGYQYRYSVPTADGDQLMVVTDQTTDRVIGHGPHWEAGPAKDDVRVDPLGRLRVVNGKAKVYYIP